MLRSYIERRETFLHGRDTNRRSLPFEWGLEHLGLSTNGNSQSAMHDYAARALSDSSAFYRCGPAPDYEFNREILKFRSAIQTPYPENNTVYGRVFESGKDLAVVVLPQWNCKWDGQVALCRVPGRSTAATAIFFIAAYAHEI